MDIEEALAFLREHRPMPPDAALTQELVHAFDEARRACQRSGDERCIPLLLQSFGDGSGFGTYQLVEDALRAFSDSQVVPHLRAALTSEHRGVRYWAAQIAAIFPAASLVEPITKLLGDADVDIRAACVTALERIGTRAARVRLREALLREREQDLRELMEAALGRAE